MSPSCPGLLRTEPAEVPQHIPHARVDAGTARVCFRDLVLEIRVIQRPHLLRQVRREHLARRGEPVTVVGEGRFGDGRAAAVACNEVREVFQVRPHAAADEDGVARTSGIQVLDDGEKAGCRSDPHPRYCTSGPSGASSNALRPPNSFCSVPPILSARLPSCKQALATCSATNGEVNISVAAKTVPSSTKNRAKRISAFSSLRRLRSRSPASTFSSTGENTLRQGGLSSTRRRMAALPNRWGTSPSSVNSRSVLPDAFRTAFRTRSRSPSIVFAPGVSRGGAGGSRINPRVGIRMDRLLLSNALYMRYPGCGISNTPTSERTAIRATASYGTGRSKSRKKFGEPSGWRFGDASAGVPVGADQPILRSAVIWPARSA